MGFIIYFIQTMWLLCLFVGPTYRTLVVMHSWPRRICASTHTVFVCLFSLDFAFIGAELLFWFWLPWCMHRHHRSSLADPQSSRRQDNFPYIDCRGFVRCLQVHLAFSSIFGPPLDMSINLPYRGCCRPTTERTWSPSNPSWIDQNKQVDLLDQ